VWPGILRYSHNENDSRNKRRGTSGRSHRDSIVREARGIERLRHVIATLRGEQGCPWDRKQTLESLKPYLIEEAYELVEAIESGLVDRHLEELGDVLLQVMLQSQLREEEGHFDFETVADALASKLVRRHPHVFGDTSVSSADEVLRNWEKLKKQEAGRTETSILDGVPRHLPALQKAQRVQSRVARVGFDWPDKKGAWEKLEEELEELQEALKKGNQNDIAEELGDVLFSLVNVSRLLGLDAEQTMQKATGKFVERFRNVENRIVESGKSITESSPEEMEACWRAEKRKADIDAGAS